MTKWPESMTAELSGDVEEKTCRAGKVVQWVPIVHFVNQSHVLPKRVHECTVLIGSLYEVMFLQSQYQQYFIYYCVGCSL